MGPRSSHADRLKVNWFSPVPPARSEIAQHTARALEALKRLVEVRVYTSAREWALPGFDVQHYSAEQCNWPCLNSAANVYNLGNNSLFHSDILAVSRAHPGIVVLHDLVLHDLIAGHFLAVLQKPQAYMDILEHTYGSEGLSAAAERLRGERSPEEMARDFPLTEAVVRDAPAIVCHTRGGFEMLCSLTPAPVRYLPLPYASSPSAVTDRWKKIRERRRAGPCRLVIFGFLAANRRIHAVLEALAGMPERGEFVLDIYGDVWDPRDVQSKINGLGLTHAVRLHGFVENLDDRLADADLALNLRYPTMGEASASQLRIWDHGLPTVVTQTGWYAELPADIVSHIRPEAEIEDLQTHLRAFLNERERFIAMGERGRQWLLREHAPEKYADGIVTLAREASDFEPALLWLRAADRVGRELADWLPGGCEAVVGRIIDETALLAGG